MAQPQLPEGFDVNDPDMYASRLPREEWEELRRTAPVWWQAQPGTATASTTTATGC